MDLHCKIYIYREYKWFLVVCVNVFEWYSEELKWQSVSVSVSMCLCSMYNVYESVFCIAKIPCQKNPISKIRAAKKHTHSFTYKQQIHCKFSIFGEQHENVVRWKILQLKFHGTKTQTDVLQWKWVWVFACVCVCVCTWKGRKTHITDSVFISSHHMNNYVN